MKEVIISSTTLDGGQQFKLDYSVVQDSNKVYGVEIEKIFENSIYSEVAVAMISKTKEDALEWINKLVQNEVTPLTLEYIMQDSFGSR